MRILWFEIYSLIVEFSYVKKNLVIFGHHSVKNEEAQSFGGTMFFDRLSLSDRVRFFLLRRSAMDFKRFYLG